MRALARDLVAAYLARSDWPRDTFAAQDDDGIADCIMDALMGPLLDAIEAARREDAFQARREAGFPSTVDNVADLAA